MQCTSGWHLKRAAKGVKAENQKSSEKLLDFLKLLMPLT
jgi:hypothetical protein